MAKARSGNPVAQGSTLRIAAVALALIGYVLLPLVHAGHHLADSRHAAAIAAVGGGDVHPGQGCRHSTCRSESPATPGDQPEPGENRHDQSSCDICQALAAARKGIDLPTPGVMLIAPAGTSVIVHIPAQVPTATVELSSRTSRGPPRIC